MMTDWKEYSQRAWDAYQKFMTRPDGDEPSREEMDEAVADMMTVLLELTDDLATYFADQEQR